MNLGNYQKTPLATSLNRIAQESAATAIQQFGKALPCSVVAVKGQIVKVKFSVTSPFTIPQVTIPIATSLYDWLPVRPGDTGVTMPADVYLGGISGLGGGTANMTQRANLTALVFVPVSNTAWTAPDPTQRVVQGTGGVLLQDLAAASVVNIQPTQISLTCGGHSIVINSTGVIIDGHVFLTHQHTDPQGGDTGGVV